MDLDSRNERWFAGKRASNWATGLTLWAIIVGLAALAGSAGVLRVAQDAIGTFGHDPILDTIEGLATGLIIGQAIQFFLLAGVFLAMSRWQHLAEEDEEKRMKERLESIKSTQGRAQRPPP